MPHKDPEIQAAIDEARRIVREDKVLEGQRKLHERFNKQYPEEPEVPEGTPPAPEPVKPGDKPTDPPKKRKLWWPEDSGD
jgi:hypothetical protein